MLTDRILTINDEDLTSLQESVASQKIIKDVIEVNEDQIINQVQKNTPSKITKAKQYKRK